MHITIESGSYYAVVDHRLLAIQGEANTRTVTFTYSEVSGAESYFLRVQLPDSLIYDLPISDQSILLPASVTVAAGIVPIQWIAKKQDGSLIAKSQIIPAIVKPSIDGDVSALPTPEKLITKYDTYLSTMEAIQQNVTQTSATVKSDADRAESSVSRAETLLQSIQGLTIGERARIYVDPVSGLDTNSGTTLATAVQTLDRALVLANLYQQAILCLKKGQVYAATDKSNEFGSGIHLYHRSIRMEAIQDGTTNANPQIQNSIFVYDGFLELKNIDLYTSESVLHLYHALCCLKNTKVKEIRTENCLLWMEECTFYYLNQDGGFSSMRGGKVNSSVQVDDAGILNMEGVTCTGYVGYGIFVNGINIYDTNAKKIAEDSVKVMTVYVNSASGSDNNTGESSEKPYRTLEKALDATEYAKKTIIYLAAGTYTIPDKTLTLIGRDVRIYGDTAETTTIYGEFICDHSFLYLARVTLDNTDSETADTTLSPIYAHHDSFVRLNNATINAANKYCINTTEHVTIAATSTTFAGATTYAILGAGFSDIRLYECVDNTEKGIRSGGGCTTYITNLTGSTINYSSGNYGIIFVNGVQVAPDGTATTSLDDEIGE